MKSVLRGGDGGNRTRVRKSRPSNVYERSWSFNFIPRQVDQPNYRRTIRLSPKALFYPSHGMMSSIPTFMTLWLSPVGRTASGSVTPPFGRIMHSHTSLCSEWEGSVGSAIGTCFLYGVNEVGTSRLAIRNPRLPSRPGIPGSFSIANKKLPRKCRGVFLEIYYKLLSKIFELLGQRLIGKCVQFVKFCLNI